MIGVRLNTFNDNSGEPEQDANSALTELDKGLRSGKVGEQCEAIVRFPRLFEKYPFPILINSSFLKLADVFRMGNNFLRLWVLRVCQQSEKHLDKILNVDEFLRRVFSVLHSNDPVARALALRTLGAVAGIIPERQNVHHAIRRGLDSHDNVEVDAAIYATTRFAAHSNAFAVAMCNKLSDMVECESTGAERRAKLVRALRSVHGGAVRAQGVLKLLRSLLERFPSSSSVRAAITALTAIAADTVVHVPDQVELLLSLAMNDARSAVRRAALVGLKKLAEHAALWPLQCIQDLVRAATDSQDQEHTMLCLQVMEILVECPAICAAAGQQASALRQYCADAALSAHLPQAATACGVLTRIVLHCYEESLPVDGSELMLALESLVIATGVDNDPTNIKPLRIALRCLVKLSIAEPTIYAARTATVLGIQLQECDWKQGGPRILALLEALGALGGSTYCPHSIAPAMPALLQTLDAAQKGEAPTDSSNDGTALVLLCTVLFQERAGTALTYKINSSWEQKILDTIRGVDGWTRYRVARAALRYGHQNLAADILKRLAEEAPSESAQRWLTALHRAASADALLLKEGISGLEAASSGWEVSSGWGGAGCGWGAGCAAACAGCGGCAPLPAAAMGARAQALAALARAAVAARAACTQPPPAIAHAHAQAARDPAAKAGACASATRRAARAVSAVAQRYAAIARTAFHADNTTLAHLHIAQYTYAQLAHFLDRVTCNQQDKPSDIVAKEIRPTCLEEMIALAPSAALAKISAKLFDNPTTGQGITHRPQRQVKGVQITVTATPHPRSNEKTVELTNIQPALTAVQTVTPVRDFFAAQQLVGVNAAGLYTVAVECAFVDERGELWNTGPRTSIVIKAHEDPTAKGIVQNTRSRF
ncbi:integrator complex subunit 7 [Ostrinia nubilalis]|uniref:integrator complex subunit 7 n=1 Tax=Ostrinia nubilalis TaxID=29057 RepID=UPI0030822621